MQSLATTFTFDQFVFRQLARQGVVILLEKSKPTHRTCTYEVIIAQVRPAETVHGREYPVREVMPRADEWGIHGWSLTDLTSAEARFQTLVNSR